jgi:hypothetical protein
MRTTIETIHCDICNKLIETLPTGEEPNVHGAIVVYHEMFDENEKYEKIQFEAHDCCMDCVKRIHEVVLAEVEKIRKKDSGK